MSDEDTKKTIELDLPDRFKGKAFRELNPEPETQNPAGDVVHLSAGDVVLPSSILDPPSSILVKIERVERGDGPMIRLPYEDGSGSTPHYDFAPEENTFEVPVIVAAAAVATGFFRAVE